MVHTDVYVMRSCFTALVRLTKKGLHSCERGFRVADNKHLPPCSLTVVRIALPENENSAQVDVHDRVDAKSSTSAVVRTRKCCLQNSDSLLFTPNCLKPTRGQQVHTDSHHHLHSFMSIKSHAFFYYYRVFVQSETEN